MTARIRRENESYSEYRENLKAEAKEEKRRGKGTMIWDSRRGTVISKKRCEKREKNNA